MRGSKYGPGVAQDIGRHVVGPSRLYGFVDVVPNRGLVDRELVLQVASLEVCQQVPVTGVVLELPFAVGEQIKQAQLEIK